VRDDRLGCPAQLARQYFAGGVAANHQVLSAIARQQRGSQ